MNQKNVTSFTELLLDWLILSATNIIDKFWWC